MNEEKLLKRIKLLENKLIEVGHGQYVEQSKQDAIENQNKVSVGKQIKREKKMEKLFQNTQQKKIAFQLAYNGSNYCGLEGQSGMEQTIEHHLFQALVKVMLVKNRDECDYARAGRTDKGVSALGNVISLRVRAVPNDDYLSLVNRLLPDDIKLIDQAIVSDGFNARYDCFRRIYKYYFYREMLDIDSMKQASNYFLGEHDFRNFCKLDVIANQNFIRTIYSLNIEKIDDPFQPSEMPLYQNDPRLQLFCAIIEGNAFLWHQIRCIMQVLFHVGRGYDEPNVVEKLLQVNEEIGKPQYDLAPDYQLVLYNCLYPENLLKFEGKQSETFLMYIYGLMKEKLSLDYIKQFIFIQMGSSALGMNIQEIKNKSIDFDQQKQKDKKVRSILEMSRGPTPQELIKNLKGKRKDLYDIKMQKVTEYEEKQKQQFQSQDDS